MKLNSLVVLNRQVVPGSFQVSDLHEEASDQSLADVQVVVTAVEVGAASRQLEPLHDARELGSHVVTLGHRTSVDEVVERPSIVTLILLIGVVDVQHGEMIAVNMGESHLSFVSLFPHVTGTNKTLRNFKRKHRNKKRTGTDRHLNAHIHKHPCFSLSPVRSLVVTPKFILRTFAHLSLHEKERRDEREKLVCVCVCELRTITFR